MASSSPPPSPVVVSSLRSRFEQLAHATHHHSHSHSKSPNAPGYLTPEPPSPRTRTPSNADADGDEESTSYRPQQQHIRTSSSSSDLRTRRTPPPPPPSRGTSSKGSSPPQSKSTSPLMRSPPRPPSTSPSMNGDTFSTHSVHPLSRKPPPPPPSALCFPSEDSDSGLTVEPIPSVASLRSKFSNPSNSSNPSFTSSPSSPRILSQSPAPTLASPPAIIAPPFPSRNDIPRKTRQSPSTTFSSPQIQLHIPFSEDEADTTRMGPPLPSRTNRELRAMGETTVTHRRNLSFDSIEPVPTSGSSSRVSSESDYSSTQSYTSPSPPNPPAVPSASRPPPRHKSSLPSSSSSSSSTTPTLQVPPPLPSRKSPPSPTMDETPVPPHLPTRRRSTHDFTTPSPSSSNSASSLQDRKIVGSPKITPPPTRTLAPGDKLPARRIASESSDESGDEEDSKGRTVDSLPDSSNSSRRPPVIKALNYANAKVHLPHHGVIAVAGDFVVVAHHHVKVYHMGLQEAPLHDLDLKDLSLEWRVKEPKVTSIAFRPVSNEADAGCLVWLGTKDGHIWELDARTGSVIEAKQAAHTHAITHMFRHGNTMITLDENGKALVFTPDHHHESEIHLGKTHPRVVRVTDKHDFVQMLGGFLWTACRTEVVNAPGQHPLSSTPPKTPVIKVYEILSQSAAIVVGKSITPTESMGAVTCGALMPSQPTHVYLGHEGGYVTVWSTATENGVPTCVEVVKVSASDVLCLEGVCERLWAAFRNGTITAYDVVPTPWIATNRWMAHQTLPVQKLFVDPYSIEKCSQLCVVSVGRDEQVKFWDGLLGAEWIDHELHKREAHFSTFRDLKVLIVSWNVDSSKPDTLVGCPENVNFLENALKSVDCPDIVAVGLQEVIDLESRRMAAKTVLMGVGVKKKTADGSFSEKVSRSYKMWTDRVTQALRMVMPVDCPYSVVQTENLVGMLTCIFVKSSERSAIKDIAVSTVKRGMGGRFGNKGGILTRFTIDDTSLCFLNCHLAAGQHHVRQRNADVAAMLEDKLLFPGAGAFDEALQYVGGGDGSMVLDHEIVFLSGDLNYRIDQRRDPVVQAVYSEEYDYLRIHDQLLKEMKFNRGFRLRSFLEAPLLFPPTYKYDRASTEYDSSEKRRVPAWCDRVLWRSLEPSRVNSLHYKRYEANVSDHRPISSAFRMTVKSIRPQARAATKAKVEALWLDHQQHLLLAVHEFYAKQQMI